MNAFGKMLSGSTSHKLGSPGAVVVVVSILGLLLSDMRRVWVVVRQSQSAAALLVMEKNCKTKSGEMQ